MLSLTKKSDPEAVVTEHWHANFRNFERLPDTKVVRTTFFVNTAAIAIAAVLLLWLASREVTNFGIRDQINEAQRQIEANRKQNGDAIRLSKAFADEQKKLAEAASFVSTPFLFLEFVDRIGQTLPKEIVIDYVESRMTDPKKSTVMLRGRVAGSPDQASGMASAYSDQLKADPVLSKLFDSVTLTRIDRNPDGTAMAFEISLNLKAAK